MDDNANFVVTLTSDDESNLQKLNEILNKFGVKVSLDRMKSYTELDLGLLTFSWDPVELEEKRTRKAGRKSMFRNSMILTDEVRERIHLIGPDATAKELGISKQWLYMRLKEKEKKGDIYF